MGQGGFLGVDLFFTLSGFLITALLVQEWDQAHTISFKNFYARRALRLLPPLFVLVALCIAGVLVFPPKDGSAQAIKSILVALFYLSNWLPVFGLLYHTWSLGIEEQFYIVWPLLLFLFLRLRLGNSAILFLLFVGVVLIGINKGVLWSHHTDANIARVYMGLDTRSDNLLIGCMAGILVARNLIPRTARSLKLIRIAAVVSAAGLSFLLFTINAGNDYLYYGLYAAVGVMTSAVVVNMFYAPVKPLAAVLEWPPLRWFGRLSYGLYLWHFPVYVVYEWLAPPFPVRSYTLRIMLPFAIKFALSCGVAALSFRYIEQPALRLKRHFRSAASKDSDRAHAPAALRLAPTVNETVR
jgi:peptidoglycan/LPS O-acetylase OafA/YrhL